MKRRASNRIIDGRRGVVLGAAIAIATLSLAGCTGSVGAAGPTASNSTVVVDAMNPVTQVKAPTEAFAQPTDKHILILYCGSSGQGCVAEANETKAVAESLGWKVDMLDGKLDPTVSNQLLKQAAQTGVDGIIDISADPNLMADAMAVVQAKNIPFVLTAQVPTDKDVAGVDTYLGADPVSGGKDLANWIAADSNGKANVLLLNLPGYYSAETRTATIAEKLKSDCSGCVVQEADIPVQTMGTSLAPLVTSRLQQNPNTDYVVSPDDCCLSFIDQGIQQANKTSSIKVVSEQGFPDQLANIAAGTLAADQATPLLYESWLSIDSLGRLMAGLPTEKFWAMPQRLWTTANIGEAPQEVFTSGWNLDFDYQSMFKKLWGKQ
ncbi:MAG: Monosaccharide transporter substrate-binding protein family [Subtercola sp.]|nr:Monosaccharide transporter substrate-binding protein family [Subtercola sp.]